MGSPGRYEFGFCAEVGAVELDVTVVANLTSHGPDMHAAIESVRFDENDENVPDALSDTWDLENKAVEHFLDYAPSHGEFAPGRYFLEQGGPGRRRECAFVAFLKAPGEAHYYALVCAENGDGLVLEDYVPFRCGDWRRCDGADQDQVKARIEKAKRQRRT